MLISDKIVKTFDKSAIRKNDAIRVQYAKDRNPKNGFVTQVCEDTIQMMYGNPQGNSTSFLMIPAVEVAAGLWDIFWTSDFITINHESGPMNA